MKKVLIVCTILSALSANASVESANQELAVAISRVGKLMNRPVVEGSINCENTMPYSFPGYLDLCTFNLSEATSCRIYVTHGGYRDSYLRSRQQHCNYAIRQNSFHVKCTLPDQSIVTKYLPRRGSVVSACVDPNGRYDHSTMSDM
ncbi:MAG: hypothetical protein ACXWRE_14125 [Pseudobdellovibrionaceae bacterium]